MSIPDIRQIPLDSSIVFRSLASTDRIEYYGVLDGLVTYTKASRDGFDIVKYHADVRRTVPDIKDIEDLSFFYVRIMPTGGGTATIRPFANEWIEPGTLNIVQDKAQVKLTVWDVKGNDPREIIRILNAAGYTAKIDQIV